MRRQQRRDRRLTLGGFDMAELMQPNIVGNFLNAYQSGLERQEAQKEAERQRMRQDRADQMSEQRFGMEMDANTLDMAIRRTQALNELLAQVPDGDEMAFQSGVQRASLPVEQGGLGIPREMTSHLTVKDLPRLKMQTGQTMRELELKFKQAQIGTEEEQGRAARALATQRYAAASGGGGGAPQADDSELDTNDPFAGLSPKAKERLILQNAKEYASVAKQNDAEAQAAGSMLNQARRFAQLSSQVNAKGDWSTGTGALAGFPGFRQIQGALDSRFSEMEAISAQLIPKLREPGSGATSDFDARMFARGTVGVEKPGPANRALSLGLVAASQNVIDKARFEEAYFKARKTLVGAQEAWQGYLEENPIFDTSSSDADLKLNKSRVGWKQYFGLNAAPSQRASASAAASGSSASAAGTGAPQSTIRPGTIEDGYRFLGGDPSNQANWVKVK